jgi:hypothetical protein
MLEDLIDGCVHIGQKGGVAGVLFEFGYFLSQPRAQRDDV